MSLGIQCRFTGKLFQNLACHRWAARYKHICFFESACAIPNAKRLLRQFGMSFPYRNIQFFTFGQVIENPVREFSQE